MLLQLLALTFIGSIISLGGALVLALKKTWTKNFSLHLTAFSSGILLSTSLLHLAPEALEQAPASTVFPSIFLAIVIFFLLERLTLWYHHHHEPHDTRPQAFLITVGDTIHNFIDGVLIASAFLIDPMLGVVTTIAVAAHEIPQEIAEFSILVSAGYSKKKALILNILSSLSAVMAAILTYLAFEQIKDIVPHLIAFSAGMFLYISLSDLIPELHHSHSQTKEKWTQILFFFTGISIFLLLSQAVVEVDQLEHSNPQAEYSRLNSKTNEK